MSEICDYCNKHFNSKYSLNKHKKTAKFCINIRKNNNIDNTEIFSYDCEYCSKSFTSNESLNKHLLNCLEKIKKTFSDEIEQIKKTSSIEIEHLNKEIIKSKKIINEQENEIIELKMTIAELTGKNKVYEVDLMKIAMQPRTTNTNNNIYNNLSVFDKDVLTERLNSTLQNITAEQLYEGQKSVAKILAPCLDNGDGTKMISCSDKSRGTLVSKDKNGNINKDFNAKNLVDVIHPIVLTKADEVNKNDIMKREKSYKLKSLKDDIEKRDNEIERFRETMKGFKKNTSQYLQHQEWIRSREEKNERDIQEIEDLEYEGIEEPRGDDFILFDEKLVEGIEDITKMKEDSTKFKNSLSKEI
jgi:predicted  nucleic acid-binding Zn-ribbon protein